ncbi:hypothetical protein RIF29_15432 [Crotalaria pallida]|uniref:Uncharacterized protein n=1 Tax=Crotalaria pallida TaxID=3830 RepID=A0AAN9FD54_CROPI
MKLVKSMTFSIDEMLENFSSTQKVVEDQNSRLRQREKLLQQTTDAQKQRELLREKRNQYEVEAESIDKEAGKLDEEKQTLLKEALEKCDGEVKKLEDEAMNCIAESKELVLAIMSYESSYIAALSMQEKLNDNWGKKQTLLKEAVEKCDGEVKKLEDETRNCITESKELVLAIKSHESLYVAALSEQEKLNAKWDSFKTDFANLSWRLGPNNGQPQSQFQGTDKLFSSTDHQQLDKYMLKGSAESLGILTVRE